MPGQSPQVLKGLSKSGQGVKSIKDTEPSIPFTGKPEHVLQSLKASAAPWTAQSPRITATVSLGSTSPDSKKDRSGASVIPDPRQSGDNRK